MKLFKIARHNESKSLIEEYNSRKTEDGSKKAAEWFFTQEEKLNKRMQEDVRRTWLIEDISLVSLYGELLELVYTAISFCWQGSQGPTS